MNESIVDLRDRLRPRLPVVEGTSIQVEIPAQGTSTATEIPVVTVVSEPSVVPEVSEPVVATEVEQPAAAFAVESDNGKIVIAMPAEERETAQVTADDFLLRLSGRLVEAEKANGNGAFWSYGDLEFGLPSIAYGPLNWLHQERKVVGVLTDAQLVNRDTADRELPNPYVRADALLWKWLYPAEAREVASAAGARQLWYSMECIARKVQCVGDNGCGNTVDYRERSAACVHIRERSAHRRLVDPIFQGAAIIVPPVQPGWANADLEVTRQAAALVEDRSIEVPGLSTSQAEQMVAQVLAYANSR